MAKNVTPFTLSQYRALVAGIPMYCPTAVFTVAGQTFTAPQAVSYISTVLNAVAATASAKGAWKDAIIAEEKMMAQEGATVKAIRANIATMFSNQLNTLTAFEITPKKAYVPLSAAKRAAATAKAKATRIARGTTSKKQKALVTGNVTGVTITPTVAGSKAPTSAPSGGGTASQAPAPSTSASTGAGGSTASSGVQTSAPVVTTSAPSGSVGAQGGSVSAPVASAGGPGASPPAPAAPAGGVAPAASGTAHS